MRKMVFSDASFLDDAQMEEDNREIMRLLRENSTQDKLEGLKRLIALSAPRPRRQLLCLPHARCGLLALSVAYSTRPLSSERWPGRVQLFPCGGARHASPPRPAPRRADRIPAPRAARPSRRRRRR